MENCTPSIRGVLQRERFRVRMQASGLSVSMGLVGCMVQIVGIVHYNFIYMGLSKDLGFCGLGCGLQDLRFRVWDSSFRM